MSKRDYYDILGVAKNADEKALKGAYRNQAKKYHPDANPGNKDAEAHFKEVNEAYDVLKDPQKRAAYDRFGHQAFQNGGSGRGGAGFGPDFNSSMSDIFEDLFGDFMGGGRGQRQGRGRNPSGAQRGSDLRYNLEINLTDAFAGKSAQIRVPTSHSCEQCNGTGAKPGTQPTTCRTCGGAGAVRSQSGFFTVERACPTCNGRGSVIADPCARCHGQGRVSKEETQTIDIPPGVEDGTRIRVAGRGEAGLRGGPAGDLYIFISLRPHEFFKRDGADLFCQVPISMATAALGGEIEVPTIDGKKARVSIPEGAQNGKQFRLKQKGMPVLRSHALGDMYIQVTVETPVNLTRKQRELLREFDKDAHHNSPESEGFFAKAKAFWESFGG
ncbi:MAG: molecular chaperone DnaJ [Alphaproteobacteria bacterium]|nr:molecular chaperone DnaJ [Alphaproteobacteria bacterium]